MPRAKKKHPLDNGKPTDSAFRDLKLIVPKDQVLNTYRGTCPCGSSGAQFYPLGNNMYACSLTCWMKLYVDDGSDRF
jgi:hypothetical protein